MQRFDQVVVVDFETYFSKTYSLKLKEYNTSGYIRNDQFKTQCVGLKINDDDSLWIPHDHVAAALGTIDWSRSALLCHHTGFDGLILSHHYGIFPAYCYDTLSMARALHSNGIGASLDELATFYKLGNKLPNVLNETKGVYDLPPELMDKLGQYCAVDVELCYKLFHKMIDRFGQDELDLIDMTVRMFTEPVLHVDQPRVEKELEREIEHKAKLIEIAETPKTTLSSNLKFADALRGEDIVPPTKISPTTGKTTYAFAKNDLGFQTLRQHQNERVRNLIEARLAVKSTIGETRAKRFLTESDAGSLPVYLSYYGAHTGRWSGGNKLNMQNLKRGGELRKSVLAPPGHVLVVVDSAQIEARMLAWFADDGALLQLFREGKDVYKYMASDIYGVPVADITKAQRFVGKVAVLGLGYNMGWLKFQWTLATGAMGPPVIMTDWECQEVVSKYRNARWRIQQTWGELQDCLNLMCVSDRTVSIKNKLYGDCETNKIYLPNGMYLEYPGLQIFPPDEDKDEWADQLRYFGYTPLAQYKGHPPREKGKNIYGGLLTENITQALSRIVVSDQMLAIEEELRPFRTDDQIYKIVTMTHDEIVACVPEEAAEDTYHMMMEKMMISPTWCVDLPLGAEGGWAREYSK
jgi:DNA polymerase I-like protein with 3'-5' exonuclease and polymerase domains